MWKDPSRIWLISEDWTECLIGMGVLNGCLLNFEAILGAGSRPRGIWGDLFFSWGVARCLFFFFWWGGFAGAGGVFGFLLGAGLGCGVMVQWRFSWYFLFPKILSFNSWGNSWGNTSLLLIGTLRFTCGEKKIWSAIKNFQKIMNMIVCKIFFCFLSIY